MTEVGLCDECGVEWRSGEVVDMDTWLCWKCIDNRHLTEKVSE